VIYDTYDADETLEAKMMAGDAGYDVVSTSTDYFSRQIKAGIYRPLDKSLLPNWKNLDARVLAIEAEADPGNRHAVPYLRHVNGFAYNTEQEETELWIAAATAAGVDISRDLVEKRVVAKFVPRVIQLIAASASAEMVETWTARLIPVVSSTLGAGLNYYFMRVWGQRAVGHFRQRHLEARRRREQAIAMLLPQSDAS